MKPVLQVVHRAITRVLLDQAGPGLKVEQADSGAVTLIQRFGFAANLNIHLHCLVLDAVYRCDAEGEPVFVEVPAPIDEALQTVLHKIITRMMKLLTRRGCWSKRRVRPIGLTAAAIGTRPARSGRCRPLRALTALPLAGAGQKVLTLQGAMPRDADFDQTLCA
jgi:hypothetical protein